MTTPRLPNPPRQCAVCLAPLPPRPVHGRFRRYCGDRCAHRLRKAVEMVKKWTAQRDRLDAKIAERQPLLDRVARTWR